MLSALRGTRRVVGSVAKARPHASLGCGKNQWKLVHPENTFILGARLMQVPILFCTLV